jgi:D-hexose-6-phosphate mutarotase
VPAILEPLRKFEIPGRVAAAIGKGGLAKLELRSVASTAEIYLHGAHVTGFKKHGEAPLLFVSSKSRFAQGLPIRGGVPICFPWFGPRDGEAMHGFARLVDWELVETAAHEDAVRARFRLPIVEAARTWPAFQAEFTVTATDRLTLELTVANRSTDRPLEYEACLHHYFAVGDIAGVLLHGLEGHAYLDKMDNRQRKVERARALAFAEETDRIYLGVAGAVEIHDRRLGRAIRVEKRNAASIVVWNPWTTRVMEDFDPPEYRRMLCVETGNVAPDAATLAPGARATLGAVLSSHAI